MYLIALGLLLAGGCSTFKSPPADNDKVTDSKRETGEKVLPAYPRADNLLKLTLEGEATPLSYAIDSQSLSTSEGGVVSYTIIVTSEGGAENILHEGIHCIGKEYMTYAYGAGGPRFQPVREPIWRRIENRGPASTRYRRELFSYYLCDGDHLPLKPEEIVGRLKRPESIPSPYTTQR